MVRSPCELSLKKGTWSPEEDHKLTAYIQRYRIWNWNHMANFAGLSRSGKSCRLRWMNYLRPNIKRGNFSKAEEEIIIKMQRELGNRWSMIASRLPGRTDNEIKNFWNTRFRKQQVEHKSPSSEFETKTIFVNFPAKTCESISGLELELEEIIPMASSSSSSSSSATQLSNLSYISSSSTIDHQAEVDTMSTSSTQPENNLIEMEDLWEDPFAMAGLGLCMVEKLADATHVQEPMNPSLLFDVDDIWQY